jgi:hypothetical protein
MKTYILTICLLLALALAAPVYSQDMGSITFINDLAAKKEASYGDAVRLFVQTAGRRSAGFKADHQFLLDQRIAWNGGYAEAEPLRRGTLALLTARYLKLDDSLMFTIFKIRRYAVTACAANGIMPADGGEWDVLSGAELIEVMGIISTRVEGE